MLRKLDRGNTVYCYIKNKFCAIKYKAGWIETMHIYIFLLITYHIIIRLMYFRDKFCAIKYKSVSNIYSFHQFKQSYSNLSW